MKKRSLVIMNIGFLNIVLSPVAGNHQKISYGILITGLFFVGLGYYLYRKDRPAKIMKQR